MTDLLTAFSSLTAEYIQLLTVGPTVEEQEEFNSKIAEFSASFEEIKMDSKFVGIILTNIDPFLENIAVARFVCTQVYNVIKNFWQNEEQIEGKDEIRPLILQCLYKCCQDETITNLFVSAISIISDCDYPTRWPDFNECLTSTLTEALQQEEPNFFLIDSILNAATSVFIKYENSSSHSDLFTIINTSVAYWSKILHQLMTETFMNEEFLNEPIGARVYIHTLQVYHELIIANRELGGAFLPSIEAVFVAFTQLLQSQGLYEIKSTVCDIIKSYVHRFLNEINAWSQNIKDYEQREVSEEESQKFAEVFFALIDSIIQLFSDEELPTTTANYAYRALIDIVKQKVLREQYLTQERFGAVWEAIQQSLSLNQSHLDMMEESPVQYFNNDVGDIEESDSTRKIAYTFMKTLTKYYRGDITEMFSGIYDKTLPEQLAADESKWVDYDRIVFFTGFVIAARTSFRDGVVEIIEGFDLVEFVQLFILPTLTPDFPYKIIQADAVKFYVDYRNIIPIELTAESFQIFLNMMLSSDISTKLYGSYLVERLCNARKLQIDSEFLAQKEITGIIKPLIESLVYDGEPVESLAATLKRIVVVGGNAIVSQAPGIVKSLLTAVKSGQKNPGNANFFHNIWETIAAAVVYTGVNIRELEEVMISTFDEIITNNSVDFIPYAIQMYGAMIQSYPAEEEPNPVLIERFIQFLDPEFWKPFGNIPALAMLITHYAHRLPAVVIENEGRILEICNELIANSRTQMCAFQIFMALITKEVSAETITAIIQIVLGHIEDNIPMFKASFAIFFCNAAFILGADNFIAALPQEIFEVWGDAITMVHQKNDIEKVVAGGLSVLEASTIPQDCWCYIFCGIVNLLESSDRNFAHNEAREARKAEEEAATQFDTTFARLVYAERVTPMHPELQGENIIQYFTIKMAEISAAKPGLIEVALNNEKIIKESVKYAFLKYQEKFGVQFQ